MRTVLFKASSPFINFTAALISELYYSDAHKILLLNGYNVYDGYEKSAVETGFFDEVYVISHADVSIVHVEQSVEQFLNEHPNIDEYFMNTFSDCYSLMIAYRLLGKAKLHIFPEGSTTVCLEKTLQLIQEQGEITSKDPLRRSFFEKYPIDLSLFDYTWLYDMDIPQGSFRAQKRHININDLFERTDADDVICRMNALFRYSHECNFDICMLDTFEPQDDYLDYEAEKRIIDTMFKSLNGKKILVKPHPPTRTLPYTKFKYQKYDVLIMENVNVPWELMLLNLLRQGKQELTIIALQLEGTYIMTSLAMIPKDFQMNVLILSNLEIPYMSKYLLSSHDLSYDYFIHAVTRSNVKLYMPNDFKELVEAGKKISGQRGYSLKSCNFQNIVPNQYFHKVGNLLTASLLYTDNQQLFAKTFFSFYDDVSELIFEVNKDVDISRLVWRPSVNNIFSSASNMSITIYDDQENMYSYSICGAEESLPMNRGLLSCAIQYAGYCKKILINVELMVYRKFCRIYEEHYERKWQGIFWENWYDIICNDWLNKYIQENHIKNIWLYGWTKISIAIASELNRLSINHLFVSTGGKGVYNDGRTDISILEACEKYPRPELIVLTPMFAYDEIIYSMPNELETVTVGLDDFIALIKK